MSPSRHLQHGSLNSPVDQAVFMLLAMLRRLIRPVSIPVLLRRRDDDRWSYTVQFLLRRRGLDVPASVQIGARLRLPHGGRGLTIHPHVVIGDDVTIYHGVTIAGGVPAKTDSDLHLPHVLVEDHVTIGAGAIILGGPGCLTLGTGSTLGAGSVLTKSMPAREVWAGNPARRLHEADDG